MEKEKEKAIIELLKQKKPYSEIEQQLHVSSRDIAHTKKKYEEQQNKIESQSEVQSEVVPFDSNVTEQHKDQKGEPNTRITAFMQLSSSFILITVQLSSVTFRGIASNFTRENHEFMIIL